MEEFDDIIDYCKINNRICPQPQKWNSLWEMLKNKERINNSWIPALPLILNAWFFTNDDMKRERLIEHIQWAENHKQIKEIKDYLLSLQETDWYHIND